MACTLVPAASDGGALASYDYPVLVVNSSFTRNSATGCGGAMYVRYASLFRLVSSNITNNEVPKSSGCGGGGVAVRDSKALDCQKPPMAPLTFVDSGVLFEGVDGSAATAFRPCGLMADVVNSSFIGNSGSYGGGLMLWNGAGTLQVGGMLHLNVLDAL